MGAKRVRYRLNDSIEADALPNARVGSCVNRRHNHQPHLPGRVRLERTPDGRRLVVSWRIDAPRDVVWDLLWDTERWADWGPSVRAVDCPVRYVEAGTTGRVRTPVGWVPFEVTACGNYRWSWDVAGLPATGHRVEASAGGGCEASFEVPPLAAPYTVVCERALGRIELLALDRAGGGN